LAQEQWPNPLIYILCRAKLTNFSTAEHIVKEGSNYLITTPLDNNPTPCLQQRETNEANYQPQEAEQVGGSPALEKGRYENY